jgi:hypothetical protein
MPIVAISDLESPHFSTGWSVMAEYVSYLFNLQHNTGRTVIEQCMHLNAYKEYSIIASCEMDWLRHDNAILYYGAL